MISLHRGSLLLAIYLERAPRNGWRRRSGGGTRSTPRNAGEALARTYQAVRRHSERRCPLAFGEALRYLVERLALSTVDNVVRRMARGLYRPARSRP
jgi:hypothetical protein